MATLEQLFNEGKLKRHRPALEPSELSERVVYFAPDFDEWLVTDLQPLPCFVGRKVTPFEQAEQILYEYVVGLPMAYGVHYKKLEPHGQHTWEFRTPDVRLFGWVPQKAHFVVVRGALKNQVKRFRDYAPYIADVVTFRASLDLNEPKSVTGVRANDVL